jgi:hypothetical protein
MTLSLERALEYIAPDEYVEATPSTLRLRKKILNEHDRKRSEKQRSLQVALFGVERFRWVVTLAAVSTCLIYPTNYEPIPQTSQCHVARTCR